MLIRFKMMFGNKKPGVTRLIKECDMFDSSLCVYYCYRGVCDYQTSHNVKCKILTLRSSENRIYRALINRYMSREQARALLREESKRRRRAAAREPDLKGLEARAK